MTSIRPHYAAHLIVVKAGAIVTAGPSAEVIPAEPIEGVYELLCIVVPGPDAGSPMVIPH